MKFLNKETINIDQLPIDEDDYFEFKSSLTEQNALKDKLQKAVSGFANSGGGFFVIGIDDKTGQADGGIKMYVGKRPIQDWVDTVVNQIEPVPKYSTHVLDDVSGRGFLNESHIILIIAVDESNIGPHMAPDCRYYIRAGKHTVPARHFIVEAIRAKRYDMKPKLAHTFRIKPSYEQVLQLGIIAITNSPALNIVLSLEPLPTLLKKRTEDFPLRLPLIDQNNPFFFDVALFSDCQVSFGSNVVLTIEYDDLTQGHHKQEIIIGVESTPPIVIGNKDKKVIEALNAIEKAITKAVIG